MLRRFKLLAFAPVLAAWGAIAPCAAQTPAPGTVPGVKEQPPPVVQKEEKKDKKPEKAVAVKDLKNPTAEQVAETVIAIYGGGYGRASLQQVRRNGVERGRVTRVNSQGGTEEITFETRFIHGESFAKDKIRLEQKMPSMEYAIVYNEGKIWGVVNGTAFTPREETTKEFLSQTRHGIDALLRYKENGSEVAFVGRDKQKNIDLWVLDLTDKEKHRTRYYISANPDVRLTARVLWLEYERPDPAGGEPVKFKQTFHDYRVAQGTLVPFRSVLYANGRQVEETRISTVTYGVKMDDSYFKNPEAAAN